MERRRLAMSKVVLDVAMSLDGFTAGPNVGEAEPMGEGTPLFAGERAELIPEGKPVTGTVTHLRYRVAKP
jgi:hypothetical protein